jgi:hypothetical protein
MSKVMNFFKKVILGVLEILVVLIGLLIITAWI